MHHEKPAYKRILLKLSGEALMGDDQFGINRDTIVRMVDEVAEALERNEDVTARVLSKVQSLAKAVRSARTAALPA